MPRDRRVDLDLIETVTPAGATRVMTKLAPIAARTYAEAVAPLRRRRGDRGGWADANGSDALLLARAAWREELDRLLAGGGQVVRSDVHACYPSIRDPAVASGLADAGAPTEEIERLLGFLRKVRVSGTPGLPIGPAPSAVVADAVLSVADRAVREAGGEIVRWVDDVWIAGTCRSDTVRAFDAWVSSLAELGLQPHEGKTRSFDPGHAGVGRSPQDVSGVGHSRMG